MVQIGNPFTILVSTYDMKLVEELFPHIIVMDDGMTVADGKTKEILVDAKLLDAYGGRCRKIRTTSHVPRRERRKILIKNSNLCVLCGWVAQGGLAIIELWHKQFYIQVGPPGQRFSCALRHATPAK